MPSLKKFLKERAIKHILQRTAIVLSVMFSITPVLFAYDVVLKNGLVIHFQKYRVAEDKLFYTIDSGKETSVPLSEINIRATDQLNRTEEPPLNLPGFREDSTTPAANQVGAPLGDIVKHAQPRNRNVETRRVYTNDDFRSSSPPAMRNEASKSDTTLSHEKIGQGLQEVATYTEQEFANMALGSELSNYEFPGRAEWQSRLYAARQSQIADLRLCISDRVSDNNGAQGTACSRTNSNKYKVESLQDEGRGAAQAWRRRH